MGRDPRDISKVYTLEMDFLRGLVLWFKPHLKRLKEDTMTDLKIKTVKIAFVLKNDVHMHKDIDFGGL